MDKNELQHRAKEISQKMARASKKKKLEEDIMTLAMDYSGYKKEQELEREIFEDASNPIFLAALAFDMWTPGYLKEDDAFYDKYREYFGGGASPEVVDLFIEAGIFARSNINNEKCLVYGKNKDKYAERIRKFEGYLMLL